MQTRQQRFHRTGGQIAEDLPCLLENARDTVNNREYLSFNLITLAIFSKNKE